MPNFAAAERLTIENVAVTNGESNGFPLRRPAGRLLWKYSLSPVALMKGSTSTYPVLIGAPSRSGGLHLPFSQEPVKRETQMSALWQLKYMVRPSAVKVGSLSLNWVFMLDPMFTAISCEPGVDWAL